MINPFVPEAFLAQLILGGGNCGRQYQLKSADKFHRLRGIVIAQKTNPLYLTNRWTNFIQI